MYSNRTTNNKNRTFPSQVNKKIFSQLNRTKIDCPKIYVFFRYLWWVKGEKIKNAYLK